MLRSAIGQPLASQVDSFTDDQKVECQREIQSHLADELAPARLPNAKINFHLTSIYDHSVFEAFSKVQLRYQQPLETLPYPISYMLFQVVQQLMPQHSTLEHLLDYLVTSCHIDKAFLFDMVSKIYIATDSSPVDMQSYELCADMVTTQHCGCLAGFLSAHFCLLFYGKPKVLFCSHVNSDSQIDVVIDVSSIYGLEDDQQSVGIMPAADSNCVITLSNGTALYLRETSRSLALVCILKDSVLQQQACEALQADLISVIVGLFFLSPMAPRVHATCRRDCWNTTLLAFVRLF